MILKQLMKMKDGAVAQSGLNVGLCCGSAVRIKELVALQAEDEGIWFIAETSAEEYLQARLRALHKAIEDEFGAT